MAKCSKEQRDRAVDLYIKYERCAADVDWLQCIRQSDEGRMTWDWRPTMADPKHPRHYDEAFKRQIVQLYESGKPSRKIRRRGPTSSGPSSWATPTPGSRPSTTESRHHPHGLRLPPREQPHRTRHAPLRRQSWRKRQSRHAVIDIPPFNGIVITCALLKRMDRARSSAG